MARIWRLGAWLGCALVALGCILPCAARAQQSAAASAFTPQQRAEIVEVMRAAMKADPGILRDAIAALQAAEAGAQEATARAAIGRAGPALARTPGDPSAGNQDGDVTVVEFYDLRCPYCRRMLPVVAELLAADHGIRLVYKDIPILGAPSVLGAHAVLAAQRQGGYLKLREAVMTGPQQITEDTLRTAATGAGLDWPRLRRDMDDGEVGARLDTNLALAHTLGIQGTPAYVVGAKLLPGAVSLPELQAAVAAARAGRG